MLPVSLCEISKESTISCCLDRISGRLFVVFLFYFDTKGPSDTKIWDNYSRRPLKEMHAIFESLNLAKASKGLEG